MQKNQEQLLQNLYKIVRFCAPGCRDPEGKETALYGKTRGFAAEENDQAEKCFSQAKTKRMKNYTSAHTVRRCLRMEGMNGKERRL